MPLVKRIQVKIKIKIKPKNKEAVSPFNGEPTAPAQDVAKP